MSTGSTRQHVVGAAILRGGLVLAARRTAPPEAAGRWEFPGGKVEPGETAAAALVREIAEELRCGIEVTGWLDGAVPVGERHSLTVATARLASDEPDPVEHDALRWVGPEELDDLDWLDGDRPFLAELEQLLLDGEPLAGGNVGGAVRVGDTVRRATGPWTPAVHALLDHLARAGLRGVPRVHGVDRRGREVLELVRGEVIDVDVDELTEARLVDLGRWAREFHEAQGGFRHPGPWRFPADPDAEVVCHHDLAPYNVAFAGDRVAGVFDWDVAGPSSRLRDLAWTAWTAVPMFRVVEPGQVAHRLRLLAAAYGGISATDVLDAVEPRIRTQVAGIRDAQRAGDVGMRRLAEVGEPDRTEARLEDLLRRVDAIRATMEP